MMESQKLKNQDVHRLLLGIEAIGRGRLEAGVCLADYYPGTPASEILPAVDLFLAEKNLELHRASLASGARVFINSAASGEYFRGDARRLAAEMGVPVAANLILLGFAAAKGGLFWEAALLEQVIMEKIPERFRDANLQALRRGVAAAAEKTEEAEA
jgi:Pyruvate/2-oxoacid:ferredoxin oxidoreductase gamma subunit